MEIDMKRALEKIKKKLSGRKGFSLGELLAATAILLLASQVLAQGVTFAARMYDKSLTGSHAKQLCSSLTAVIETELRYTTGITYDENTGQLLTYFSREYGQSDSSFISIDSDENEVAKGEIAIRTTDSESGKKSYQKLMSSTSYSSYDLQAGVDNVTYDAEKNLFSVTLTIYEKNGEQYLQSTFEVIPINSLKINE